MLPGLLVLISIAQTHPPEILRSVKGKLQFGNEATIHASCSEQPSWRFVDPVQFSFGSFSVPTVRAHMIGVPASCTSVMGGIGEPCAAMGGRAHREGWTIDHRTKRPSMPTYSV